MQLEIITPEKTVFSESHIDEVLVPTAQGQIGILPHHINLVTQITNGEIIIKHKGKEQYMAVTGGFLEVAHGKVSILADYAAHAEDIDVEKAIKAQKRAEEMLKKGQDQATERDLALAAAELRKSILEIEIGTRRKHRNR
jgi:F-type H+-transporting ATPase subunit epsilon